MNTEKLAILVIGYDDYSDLWKDFVMLFNKFWSDCKYDKYFVDNELTMNLDGFKILNAGKEKEWGGKLDYALGKIPNDNILLFGAEDFYFYDYVNSEIIEQILKYITENNILFYKLRSPTLHKTDTIKGYPYLHHLYKNTICAVNAQPSIWNRNELRKVLDSKNCNGWDFEASLKENKSDKSIMSGYLYDDRNVLPLKHTVTQSVFFPDVHEFFKEINIEIDTTKRGELDKYHYYLLKFRYYVKNNCNLIVNKFFAGILKLLGLKGNL